jgi:hypothetical protein
LSKKKLATKTAPKTDLKIKFGNILGGRRGEESPESQKTQKIIILDLEFSAKN